LEGGKKSAFYGPEKADFSTQNFDTIIIIVIIKEKKKRNKEIKKKKEGGTEKKMGRRRRRRTCTWQFSLLFRHPQLFFYYNIGSARLLCTSAVVAVCVCTRASRGASRWPRLKTRANTRQTHRVAPPSSFHFD
jgi:hypothetical protein